MKTMDLDAFRVNEMNESEMKDVDGGKFSLMDFLGTFSLVMMIGAFVLCMLL